MYFKKELVTETVISSLWNPGSMENDSVGLYFWHTKIFTVYYEVTKADYKPRLHNMIPFFGKNENVSSYAFFFHRKIWKDIKRNVKNDHLGIEELRLLSSFLTYHLFAIITYQFHDEVKPNTKQGGYFRCGERRQNKAWWGWMLRRASFADQPQREGTTAAPVAYGAGPCPSQALAPISPDRTPYRADHYPVRGLPSGLHSWGLRSLLQDPKWAWSEDDHRGSNSGARVEASLHWEGLAACALRSFLAEEVCVSGIVMKGDRHPVRGAGDNLRDSGRDGLQALNLARCWRALASASLHHASPLLAGRTAS